MENSRVDPTTLVAVVIAVALALGTAPGSAGYLTVIGGVTLLLVLFAYDRDGYRSGIQSLAFSAACGLCFLMATAILVQYFADQVPALVCEGKPGCQALREAFFQKWFAITWSGATILFLVLDRFRMGSRESVDMGLSGGGVSRSAVVTSSGAGLGLGSTEQIRRPIVYSQPPVAPAPVETPVEAPSNEIPPSAASAAGGHVIAPVSAPTIAPAAVPAAQGKEVMIFVNLMGEGLNVLRSVKAEHMGRDFYKISDVMPDGETWEYQPGQIVRCRKKALSNGKHLVAVEEAPRAS